MSSDEHILAIDLGTSGCKVALVSVEGRMVGGVVEPYEVLLLDGGGAEQRTEDWWEAIVRGTRRLLLEQGVDPSSVVGIGSSVQWSGTVPVDRDGNALSNAVIWMDSRGAEQVRRITRGIVKVQGYGVVRMLRWIRVTGGGPQHSGKDPIAHILWIKAHRPDLYAETHVFLEPKDWLGAKLSGRIAASHDSITLHWVTDNRDLARIDYHPGLLRMAGLDRAKLPDLIPPASVLGTLASEAASELGLSPEVRVASGMSDVMAAPIGAGAVLDYQAHVYVGTSSWLTCHVPRKKTDLAHNMASLPSGVPGRYLLANEQESAGACVAWFKDHVVYPRDELTDGGAPDDFYRRFDALAATAPAGSGGLVFTPWLNGERSPVDDRLARGSFFNQSLRTTRAHMARAILEGVACNSRWLLRYVERFIGRRLEALTMIGGGANSELWCQIHADVLDRPIRQAEQPQLAGARGAALQAAVALGYLTWEQIPDRVPIARTFEPDPAGPRVHDAQFGAFVELYKRNRTLHARLNR